MSITLYKLFIVNKLTYAINLFLLRNPHIICTITSLQFQAFATRLN